MNAENQKNFFEEWESERGFIDAYENEYFEGSSSVKNTTERSFEDEIEGLLIKKEKYTPEDFAYAIGWKMGYSSKEKINEAFEKNKWKSGHGNPIKNLNKYIDFLESKQSDIKKPLTKYSRENVKEAYELLIDKKSQKKPPKNFGSVYLINILYFLSKGEIPIYDKFAHTAVKALALGKEPWEIYVGDAPSKYEDKKVVNLLDEYVYYLDTVFGKHKIDRNLDRALWVYGHLNKDNSEKK